MIKIGKQIKMYRAQKGLTQEKLAEVLGVSFQAISRWENDVTYPDINMLPSLATFFDVSVDDLLGMEDLRNEKDIARVHGEVHKMIKEGNTAEAIDTLREALKKYPHNHGIMSELSLALTIYRNYNVSETDLKEAIRISEFLLDKCVNDKIRSTVKANLPYVYQKAGYEKRALDIAQTLPHVWESREMLLPDFMDSESQQELLKDGVKKCVNAFYEKLNASRDSMTELLMTGPKHYENVSFEEKIKCMVDFVLND